MKLEVLESNPNLLFLGGGGGWVIYYTKLKLLESNLLVVDWDKLTLFYAKKKIPGLLCIY